MKEKQIIDIINSSGYTMLFVSEKINYDNSYISLVLNGHRKMGKKLKRSLENFIASHVNNDIVNQFVKNKSKNNA